MDKVTVKKLIVGEGRANFEVCDADGLYLCEVVGEGIVNNGQWIIS